MVRPFISDPTLFGQSKVSEVKVLDNFSYPVTANTFDGYGLPTQEDLIEYVSRATLTDEQRNAINGSQMLDYLFNNSEKYRQTGKFIDAGDLTVLFLWDRELLNVCVGGRSFAMFDRDVLALVSSSWRLDEPLDYNELGVIRDANDGAYRWDEITMQEFIFAARRDRLSIMRPYMPTHLAVAESTPRLVNMNEWRQAVSDESAFAWSLQSLVVQKGEFGNLEAKSLAMDYPFDTVLPYLNAGVRKPSSIRRLLDAGIDAELAADMMQGVA
jgi:hypothetical protein